MRHSPTNDIATVQLVFNLPNLIEITLHLVDLALFMLGNFSCALLFADFFFKIKSSFSGNSLRNTIRVSNNLDPDQTRHFVGSDLASNHCKGYKQTAQVDEVLK